MHVGAGIRGRATPKRDNSAGAAADCQRAPTTAPLKTAPQCRWSTAKRHACGRTKRTRRRAGAQRAVLCARHLGEGLGLDIDRTGIGARGRSRQIDRGLKRRAIIARPFEEELRRPSAVRLAMLLAISDTQEGHGRRDPVRHAHLLTEVALEESETGGFLRALEKGTNEAEDMVHGPELLRAAHRVCPLHAELHTRRCPAIPTHQMRTPPCLPCRCALHTCRCARHGRHGRRMCTTCCAAGEHPAAR